MVPPHSALDRLRRAGPAPVRLRRVQLLVPALLALTAVSCLSPARADRAPRESDGMPRADGIPEALPGDTALAELRIGDATVEVTILPGPREVSDADLLEFVRRCATEVADFYGRFPVDRATVQVRPSRRGGYGRARGGDVPSVMYLLDRDDDRPELFGDWVLVHELLHFGCPLLERRHHWFEEGLATYLEPIVRRRAGWISAEDVWGEFRTRMANGLPGEGDRGLDHTPTWGRTYWGGALFCLLADVEIRERTDNASSLRDGLRGIVDAGGSIERSWSMERTLSAADRALGLDVLVPMWEAMRADPHPVDLDALWERLGIRLSGDRVEFDDDAPLAHVRRAIAQ